MKIFKGFLIYTAIILGVLILVVAGCLATMFLFRGVTILGYQYIGYDQVNTQSYPLETSSTPIIDITAVAVESNRTSIYFLPNTQDNTFRVEHSANISGFVKTASSALSCDVSIAEKAYSQDVSTFTTLIITITEPEGAIISSDSYVAVYIPQDLNILYAKTNSGKISFKAAEDTKTINVDSFYAYSTAGKEVIVSYPTHTSNYYITAHHGTVMFKNVTTLNANVNLQTDDAKLYIKNADNNSVLNGNLVVASYSPKGPSINVDNVLGNLKLTANTASVSASNIGTISAEVTVALTVNSGTFSFNNIFGRITMASNTEANNTVNIHDVYYTGGQNHIFDCGKGNVTINSIMGVVGFDSTSGSVTVNNCYNNINVYATTGDVIIKFNESQTYGDLSVAVDGNVIIDGESGGIDVYNLRGSLNINSKTNKTINVKYMNFSAGNTTIKANNATVNLAYSTTIDIERLPFRMMLTYGACTFGSTVDMWSRMRSSDVCNNDYIEGNYQNEYRIGYAGSTSDPVYNNNSYITQAVLYITTNGNVTLNCV